MSYKNYFRELRFLNFAAVILIAIMFTFNRINTKAEIRNMHMSIDSLRTEMNVDDVIKTNEEVKKAVDSLQATLRILTVYDKKSKLQFYNDLGHVESRGNYKIVNKFGYLGKYQFSLRTVHGLGFDVTKEEFLNDTLMQEECARKYIAFNKRVLQKWIKIYDNKIFTVYDKTNDTTLRVHVTESGILAAAHLGGAGNVQKLFRNKTIFKDGFGMPITSYLKKFSGYNI